MSVGSMSVGFAGMGRMGSAIARRLIEHGVAVTVWNRSSGALEAMVAAGASVASSPAELAAMSDIVFTMLTDDRAVMAVFGGPDGLLAGTRPRTRFVEMTTLPPAALERLRVLVEEKQARLVDCPLVGSLPHVASGQLVALVGGSQPENDNIEELLQIFCRKVVFVGEPGAGAALKLVVNMMTGGYIALLGEALALGTVQGLDLGLMLDVLSDGPTACPVLLGKMPFLRGEAGLTAFDMATMAKDFFAIVSAAADGGAATPAAAAIAATYSAAAGGGWKDVDFARLPQFQRDHMSIRRTRTNMGQ